VGVGVLVMLGKQRRLEGGRGKETSGRMLVVVGFSFVMLANGSLEMKAGNIPPAACDGAFPAASRCLPWSWEAESEC
jgi:hypothetical protein